MGTVTLTEEPRAGEISEKWVALFSELIGRLQSGIQEFPYVPDDKKAQVQGRIRSDLYQAEGLEHRLSGLPGAAQRRIEVDRARSLMTLYLIPSRDKNPRPAPASRMDNNNNGQQDINKPHTTIPIDEYSRPLLHSTSANQISEAEDHLLQTERLAAETEQMGHNTMSELKRQREQLERARRNLYQTDNDIDSANRLATAMVRRARANRLVSYALMVVLVLSILLVVYIKASK